MVPPNHLCPDRLCSDRASVIKIGVSRNVKYDNLFGFPKSGHIAISYALCVPTICTKILKMEIGVVKEKFVVEDDHITKSTVSSGLANILVRCFFTILWLPLSVACLPLFSVGLYIWGLPPVISPGTRYFKYCIAAFVEGSSKDNIPFTNRIVVCLITISALIKAPVSGTCWFIDELLFSGYHRIEIKEPVFFITRNSGHAMSQSPT